MPSADHYSGLLTHVEWLADKIDRDEVAVVSPSETALVRAFQSGDYFPISAVATMLDTDELQAQVARQDFLFLQYVALTGHKANKVDILDVPREVFEATP